MSEQETLWRFPVSATIVVQGREFAETMLLDYKFKKKANWNETAIMIIRLPFIDFQVD